jgi:hypothetical protein
LYEMYLSEPSSLSSMFVTLDTCGTFHLNICTDPQRSSNIVTLCAISKQNMFDHKFYKDEFNFRSYMFTLTNHRKMCI